MAVNQRFPLSCALTILLLLLAGCGGGGSVSFPPPQGGFTNANLNGPFAFSYTGTDASGFITAAGSFTADGNGNITSGVQDLSNATGVATNAGITGTYVIRADGRGSATLNSSAGNTVINFVLVAGGHALITRFDANATASGTLDQQTPSAFNNAALAGGFAFNLFGIDGVGNPLALGGVFTSDAAGNITGVDDSNDAGTVVTNDALTGTIPVAASGRGTATINALGGTLTFAFYVVDSTHIKLVEIDNSLAVGGEAFRQTGPFSNASLSGPFAFTLAGADNLSLNPFATGGILTSNGAGTITSGSQDFNDGGTLATNVGLTGSYSMAANGRGTLTIVTTSGTFTFAIYPSSGGVLLLETDVGFLTTGTALQQSPPFSAGSFSGGYGLNFTGVTASGELDSTAQFTADGASKFNGIIDVNNAGGISFGQPLTGTFNVANTGRSTVALQTSVGTQNMVFYSVSGARALFIELDSTVVAAGEVRHQ
jgi:fibronectin-binding autotransporter adhesin